MREETKFALIFASTETGAAVGRTGETATVGEISEEADSAVNALRSVFRTVQAVDIGTSFAGVALVVQSVARLAVNAAIIPGTLETSVRAAEAAVGLPGVELVIGSIGVGGFATPSVGHHTSVVSEKVSILAPNAAHVVAKLTIFFTFLALFDPIFFQEWPEIVLAFQTPPSIATGTVFHFAGSYLACNVVEIEPIGRDGTVGFLGTPADLTIRKASMAGLVEPQICSRGAGAAVVSRFETADGFSRSDQEGPQQYENKPAINCVWHYN